MVYKALIAVNDIQTSQIIKETIKRDFREVKIVQAAIEIGKNINLNEVVKKTVAFNVDIVFISMDVGGTGGIDATAQIKKIRPETHVVVFTQYDNYDMVRQAFVKGADDCIATWSASTVIDKVISRVCRRLKKEYSDREERTELIHRQEKLESMARFSFVYSILFKGNKNSELSDYRKIFNIEDSGYVINVEFGDGRGTLVFDEKKVHFMLENIFAENSNAMIGPSLFNRVIIIVAVANNMKGVTKERAMEFGNEIVRKSNKEMEISVSVGIGMVHKMEHIHISYEESIKALRSDNSENKVDFFSDVVTEGKMVEVEFINQYTKKIEECMKNESSDTMKVFGTLLKHMEGLNEMTKKNKVLEILIYLIHCVVDMGPSECDYVNICGMASELEMLSRKEIDTWALNRMQYILKCLRESRRERISEPVRFAKQYIGKNYTKEITLAQVADMAGVSQQYFSKLFKDETGRNFVEWINTTRINKARELMDTGRMTIKEVGFEVGYNDPNYFSRAFKKYTGVTPSQYITKKGNATQD